MKQSDRAEMLERASIDAGREGLKALLILNGGACVALLTFLSSSIGKNNLREIEVGLIVGATNALVLFAVGAGLSVLTCLLSYVTNQCLSAYMRDGETNKRVLRFGKTANKIGLLASATSLVSFFIGIFAIWTNVYQWLN